ncbi:MGMT family protein [Thalassomonas sp. M1454]|uniref:MGMT family protein n=1 Tax=Thalassomonas sp. M1454 TaxID=2594477 RepID=UPI00117FA4CC|nr:methylated-DNA--[protein]-cysteine S-methyltransferase [Thalassomonas sp. M1454]TRX55714.1 methylated-DNA--[protein]-cysteine S-methyltransferase [Thalassomonas sp. M1454]
MSDKPENPNYKRIWATVLLIPKGKVASYGQIADLAGLPGKARLVGRALGFAPKSIKVPWHRVINSQGKISFPIGSEHFEQQKGLLQTEQVVVLNGRIKLKEFQWQPDLSELLFKLEY